jgi:exopolysaccharide biosynthesis polyprenyl glycosylphosphotransferase
VIASRLDRRSARAPGRISRRRLLRRPEEPTAGGASALEVVARCYPPRDVAVRRMLAVADAGGITVGLFVAIAIASGRPTQFVWTLLTVPLWIVLFKAYGLYDRDLRRISHASLDDVPWLFHAILVGCLLLFAYSKATPPGSVAVSALGLFAATGGIAVLALRALARRAARRVLGRERVVLVSEAEPVAVLARKIGTHPEYGLEAVGRISRSPSAANGMMLPLLGKWADVDLARVVSRNRVERVLVSHDDLAEDELLDLVHCCRRLGVKVSVLPRPFDAMGPSVEVDDIEGVTVLGVNPPVLPRSSRLLKRAMDIAGAACGLLLSVPLLAIVAVAIKLDSPGPVLFRQRRIGRAGREFRLVKFRTMVADAEHRHERLISQSRDPGWLLLDHDPRVTRVGHFLRHWSLDELPQLWNVLKGEMSLVGPRPLIDSEDRQLLGWRRSRVDLTPGLTGLWQVLGRTNIPFEEMIKLDYLYVTNWSLWTDVRLILRTLPSVVTRRGVN